MVKINEIKGLFWGVTLEGDKKYTQTAERPTHISMAALDTTRPQAEGSTASVMIEYNGSSFVLCTLQHGKLFQQPLDLEFAPGETLTFYITGKGSVHLSGYCLSEDDGGFDYGEDDDLSEPESDEEDVSDSDEENTKSKRKLKIKGGKTKKARMTIDDLDDDDDEDDSDDDDFVDWEAQEASDYDEDEDDLEDDFDEESDADEAPKPAAKKVKLGNGTSAKAAVVNVKAKEKTDKTKVSAAAPAAAAAQPQKSGGSTEVEGKKKKKKKKNKKKGGADQQQDSETKSEDKKTPVVSKAPTKRTAEGGVVIEDLKEGHGPEAKLGKMVRVYYTGRLSNGKIFDSCLGGNGFKFKLGKKEVISGWDVGVAGMKVGGKRKLVIPPKMGYGSRPAGPIPANSTLVFDVELKAVN